MNGRFDVAVVGRASSASPMRRLPHGRTPSERGLLSSLATVSVGASAAISLANPAGFSIPVEAGPAISQAAAGLLAIVAIRGRYRATRAIRK